MTRDVSKHLKGLKTDSACPSVHECVSKFSGGLRPSAYTGLNAQSCNSHRGFECITGQYGATFSRKISPRSMVMYGIEIIIGYKI